MNRPNRDQDIVRLWATHLAPSLYDDVSDVKWYSMLGQETWVNRKIL